MKTNKKIAFALIAAIALSVAVQTSDVPSTVMASSPEVSVSDNSLEPFCDKPPINDED